LTIISHNLETVQDRT